MERTLKIFFACAIGAGIGTFVALELSRYFWWLGVLLGGFVGYIAYEFKKVISAIQTAYKTTTNWKPDKKYWAAFSKRYFWFLVIGALSFLTIMTAPIVLSAVQGSLSWEDLIGPGTFAVLMILMGLGFFCLPLDGIICEDFDKIFTINTIKYCNPLSVYFYWFPRGLWWLTRKISFVAVMSVKFIFRFAKTLFILIHSDIRLLCGIDAAIGTAIGYLAGSAIIGFFAGGIVGVLNYEVVSKRVLRLNTPK